MKAADTLGQFEQLVLAAVMAQDGAYGLQIYKKVEELAGKEVNLGSVYTALERLRRKGYVKSKEWEGTAERGGKPSRSYHMEKAGFEALKETVETSSRVSETFFEWIGKWQKKAKPAR